jgi:hypothetical protein
MNISSGIATSFNALGEQKKMTTIYRNYKHKKKLFLQFPFIG